MPRPNLIVFDLDGTLVDTAPDLAATMNALLEHHGRPRLTLESVRLMVGRGARVTVAAQLGDVETRGQAPVEARRQVLVGANVARNDHRA